MKISARSEEPGTAASPACRILVVDDHPVMREGLSMLIQSEKDLVICGQAGDAADALRQVESTTPDLAVIDIFLPGSTNGIELTKTILAAHPEMKVVILSMHDDTIYVERAMKAGARGYVTKAEVSRVILDAIRKVWSGGTYVSRQVSSPPGVHPGSPKGTHQGWGAELLTDRELELLELFGRGFSRSQIAERLNLSVRTVEAHREHIREKLGLESSAELTRYALKWIEREENG